MTRATTNKVLCQSGAFLVLAGAALLFTAGSGHADASARSSRTTAAAPSCGQQANLNNPTNTNQKVLDSFWFAIDHQGHTTSVCTLFGNVNAGDIVTAHFTVNKDAASTSEVTLVSNIAQEDPSRHQTLFDCASFSVGADAAGSTDSCLASTTQALTVHVADCGFQVDLIYGEALASMTQGAYVDDHRWINGQVGNRTSDAACTTPTPTPTPTSSVSGITTGTPTGGTGGLMTPATGAGSGLAPQMLVGALLMVLGTAAIVYGGRRRATQV